MKLWTEKVQCIIHFIAAVEKEWPTSGVRYGVSFYIAFLGATFGYQMHFNAYFLKRLMSVIHSYPYRKFYSLLLFLCIQPFCIAIKHYEAIPSSEISLFEEKNAWLSVDFCH